MSKFQIASLEGFKGRPLNEEERRLLPAPPPTPFDVLYKTMGRRLGEQAAIIAAANKPAAPASPAAGTRSPASTPAKKPTPVGGQGGTTALQASQVGGTLGTAGAPTDKKRVSLLGQGA
jgi:hypothetical protein